MNCPQMHLGESASENTRIPSRLETKCKPDQRNLIKVPNELNHLHFAETKLVSIDVRQYKIVALGVGKEKSWK